MARLRLLTRVMVEEIHHPGTRQVVPLDIYRLYINLCFVAPLTAAGWRSDSELGKSRRFEAVVDTGAALTNIPYDHWEPFATEIRWITAASGVNTVFVGNRAFNYQLGRVMLAAVDTEGRWMPPAWTVARCWHYHDDPQQPLLGLTSPFLTGGRRLRHAGPPEFDPDRVPEWWLEDGPAR